MQASHIFGLCFQCTYIIILMHRDPTLRANKLENFKVLDLIKTLFFQSRILIWIQEKEMIRIRRIFYDLTFLKIPLSISPNS